MNAEKPNHKALLQLIKAMDLFLWGLMIAAATVLVYGVMVSSTVYQGELQRQGVLLMIAGVIFAVLFIVCWLIRYNAINRKLVDTYGEECCKPIQNPVFRKSGVGRGNDAEDQTAK